MKIGLAILILAILIITIWMFVEFKRARHKMFAIFLILLILFAYISFNLVLAGKNIDYGSIDGIKEAGGIYFSWLGSIFGNIKTITSNAIKMDWAGDQPPEEKKDK